MTPHRIRPAPVIAMHDRRRVTHTAPGFEDYFGDTPAAAEVEHEETTGRWRLDRLLLEGDWT